MGAHMMHICVIGCKGLILNSQCVHTVSTVKHMQNILLLWTNEFLKDYMSGKTRVRN